MSQATADLPAVADPVASWLLPLGDEACGPDLEYDPDFLGLEQIAAGKPETQFAPAEPPPWPDVKDQSTALMGRTRDLRVAMLWARASLNTEGLMALLPALQLLTGLLDNFWDAGLHPVLDADDGGAYARQSVLGSLDSLDGLLGDLRQSLVMADRRLGGMRVREIEIALDRLPPRADETPRTVAQLQGVLGDLPDVAAAVTAAVQGSLQVLKQLQRVMNDRFGIDQAVEVKALRLMLEAVKSVLPAAELAEAGAGEDPGAGGEAEARPAGRGGVSGIGTRKEAIQAIRLVCEYLERSEPTNPAQLLLRRAEALIEKNFLELVRDLAPDALEQVARIMGVDPESLGSGG